MKLMRKNKEDYKKNKEDYKKTILINTHNKYH